MQKFAARFAVKPAAEFDEPVFVPSSEERAEEEVLLEDPTQTSPAAVIAEPV